MIPLRDATPTRHVPFVTYGLIAVNVAVFLYQESLSARLNLALVFRYGATPALEPPTMRKLTPAAGLDALVIGSTQPTRRMASEALIDVVKFKSWPKPEAGTAGVPLATELIVPTMVLLP